MQKHFEINYLSLRVSLISQQQAELPPYLGSTLRGVIGQSLLQTDKDACAFLYRNGEDTVRTGQVVVKPYMIIPPDICMPKTVVEQEESIDFEVLLFGSAVEYVPSLILALENIHRFGMGGAQISVPFIEYHKQSDTKIYLAKGKTFDIRYRDGSFILS